MDIKHFLKDHAYQNIPLTFEEAFELGTYALQGCEGDQLAQVQSIATLSALHNQATYKFHRRTDFIELAHGHRMPEDAAEQVAGVCAAVFKHDIGMSQFGFLEPKVYWAIDNCGMGGDLTVTANVSTIAAFVAAAAGIPMCKHGSPANADKGRHGSSDFISMLGISTYASKAEVERCVANENFGYTECLDVRYKKIHLQTHRTAQIPHMNDIIGPITNPLSPSILTRKIVGINHLISPRIVTEAYRILNARGVTNLQHGIFVRGSVNPGLNGVDEVSICPGGTDVFELRGDKVSRRTIKAEDFGLDPVSPHTISPPSGMSKGDFSLAILQGEIAGPPLKMVLANAALLFYLAGRSQDLKECYVMAEAVHKKGGAHEKVLAVRKRLPK